MNQKNSQPELIKKLNRISLRKEKHFSPSVIAPANLDPDNDYLLKGYYFENTNTYNIVDFTEVYETKKVWHHTVFDRKAACTKGVFLGTSSKKLLEQRLDQEFKNISAESVENIISFLKSHELARDIPSDSFILGAYQRDEQLFFQLSNKGIEQCKLENYSLQLDVFSRNTGILETDMMQDKTAIISGCGSVGSYVDLELARSGVGRFLLIDNDILSYANVCRHQCNITDVGNFKTNAVAERIRLINPEARVECQNEIIENVLPESFKRNCNKDSIIIGCADNRQGDLFANKIAAHYRIPMVSIGFWERAFAGEIFYWIPGQKELACYKCFTEALGDLSARESVNRRFYTTQQDLSKVSFMPGISVDINFVTNVGLKIILDILNRNNEKFVPRVLDDLTQFTLVSNTNKKEIGGEQAEIFSYPLQVTTSIEVDKNRNCKLCAKQ